MADATIREQVRERYAAAARHVRATGCMDGTGGCCGNTGAGAEAFASDAFGSVGYARGQLAALPGAAVAASLGCGNPTALIELRDGQTVLDLGSGGGIDVILSARRVAPSGRAIGLDMTDEMLDLARRNAAEAGVANVEFVKGEMEALPLPAATVDVIISNCVVNLSPDKDAVLRESFRVLRPGGRFAISDVVVQGATIPDELRADMASWIGCIAGALEEREYREKLAAAGFAEIEVVVTKVYDRDDAGSTGGQRAVEAHDALLTRGGRIVSAFVRATKPASSC